MSTTISKARRARILSATAVGNALETFDFTVFSFMAAPIGKLFFPGMSAHAQLLLAFATFGVGFITRPLGGLVLGAYADRKGRKSGMMVTLGLMALASALIAVAPTYAQLGVAAPIVIVIARLLQGLAAGGESGASFAILVENATPGTRSYYTSWQFGSQGLGVVLGSLISFSCSRFLDAGTFLEWGWRVPFAFGVVIFPVGVYLRRVLQDAAPLYGARASHGSGPVMTVIRHHWTTLVAGWFIIGGTSASMYIVTFYLPTYATTQLHLSLASSLRAGVLSGVVIFLASPLGGLAADRWGRKWLGIGARVALAILAIPAFMLMAASPETGTLLWVVGVLTAIVVVSVVGTAAVVPALFPLEIRATGVGMVYAIGTMVFGGFAPFTATWLIKATGSPFGPAYYLIVIVLLSAAALSMVRDVTATVLDSHLAPDPSLDAPGVDAAGRFSQLERR